MRSNGLWSELLLTSDRTGASAAKGAPSQNAGTSSNAEDALPPRNMHDTYTEITLPFASSPELLEQYTNAYGGLRTGMLMEHLDSLAGSIAYKHVLGPEVETLGRIQERGLYFVTASVERLDMLAPLLPVRDVRLSGQVIYTGSSSMEVAVKMEAMNMDQEPETVMLGRFSMVCRDARTQRARKINSLVISTPEERSLFHMGEAAKNRRRESIAQSLERVPPNKIEAAELHAYELKYGQEDADREKLWMGDTQLEKTMLMFPQERNVHSKVFGGYLMRLAYELGFSNASLFTRSHVTFLSLDRISFARPVPIGCILRLTSQIIYSTPPEAGEGAVHVAVQAYVVDVSTGKEEMTNDFRFTWRRDDGKPASRRVVPRTYKEAMLWLEGKRALELGAKIRGRRDQNLV